MLNFTKFCETKEDFNNIYGLLLEGIDPAILTDKPYGGCATYRVLISDVE